MQSGLHVMFDFKYEATSGLPSIRNTSSKMLKCIWCAKNYLFGFHREFEDIAIIAKSISIWKPMLNNQTGVDEPEVI